MVEEGRHEEKWKEERKRENAGVKRGGTEGLKAKKI
jgi:hypothetical protein